MTLRLRRAVGVALAVSVLSFVPLLLPHGTDYAAACPKPEQTETSASVSDEDLTLDGVCVPGVVTPTVPDTGPVGEEGAGGGGEREATPVVDDGNRHTWAHIWLFPDEGVGRPGASVRR
ncbi:hypothetical protein GCM10008096_15210 [Zhihengliuella salsuginis]|uniref:Uncharacterized protein n=1 Tax=Zhihengliuella salsuginis TaxID=578222 RepID=A0ABQ3GGY3_9MICC|nr:hypothetical protein GCM10008096_15210 [Zhihengliuella salsuginis]